MGLQTNQGHVLGRDQKLFWVDETVPGTFVKPVTSTDAHAPTHRNPNVLTTSFVPNFKRKDRTDAFMASRDILERIDDKSEHTWSAEGFYVPSGTIDVAPDWGPIILAAMGVQTVNGATSVVYTLNSVQTLKTLSMTRHFAPPAGAIFQEALAGCWVEELGMSFAGGEEPKISASGGAMTYAATGTSTLNGAMVASTTMIVQTADKNSFMTSPSAVGGAGAGARSVVQIDDGSSPQTDAEVTVDSAAPSFTIDTPGSHDDAAVVTPFVPTHTDSGSPIAGINGTFTWDSFGLVLTAFEWTLKNNLKMFDDEAFTRDVTDVIPNLREITGSMTFRVRKDHVVHILNRKEFATRALSLAVSGGSAGTNLAISMPTCEMEFNEVASPQTEEATINATFRALGSSGDDALTITHT